MNARHSRGLVFDMMIKVVVGFLVFMAILAILGKWRFPGQDRLAQAKCRACGRYRIGKGRCACGRE